MSPTELHIYDLDGTLYKSPTPPVPDPTWWYHAHSFGSPKPPGYDPRWILAVVAKARSSVLSPSVRTVVITGRRDHEPMREKVSQVLSLTGLSFDAVRLQPVFFPGTTAQYKGAVVSRMLDKLPSVKKVVFYDDELDNHRVVGAVVKSLGLKYSGVVTPGV